MSDSEINEILEESQLNAKRKAFIAEYLIDKNATQAAIRAGYSEKSAGSQGYDLLQIPAIKARIERELAKLENNSRGNAQSVLDSLHEIRDIALGKVSRPKLVQVTEGSGKDRTVSYQQIQVKEVDLAAANRANELIGKEYGMFQAKDDDNTTDVFKAFMRGIAPTLGPPSLRPAIEGKFSVEVSASPDVSGDESEPGDAGDGGSRRDIVTEQDGPGARGQGAAAGQAGQAGAEQ